MNSILKVIEPSGLINASTSDDLRQQVADSVEAGATIVLIDLKQVTFVDSSGLGALVRALKLARTAGARLVLCSMSDQAKLLFEITCMDRSFEIFPNRHAFEQNVLVQNGLAD